MNVKITPSKIQGSVKAVTSKSSAHRQLICAALSEEKTTLIIDNFSEDIWVTIRCLLALGASITRNHNQVTVKGINNIPKTCLLNCGESGSSLRFLLPLTCLEEFNSVHINGEGRLPERPLEELCEVLKNNGAIFSKTSLPLEVSGKLESGNFIISGNTSSQYISGLLFSLPLLNGDSNIILTSKLESSPYVDMTISSLKTFGINIEKNHQGFFIKGNQKYISPKKVAVEGDWSNAAFFLASGALSGEVNLTGLDLNSLQGDREILKILKDYGALVYENEHELTVKPNQRKPLNIDVSQIPDLLPILSVLCALADGESCLTGAKRLRIKESDRLQSVSSMLLALGARVEEHPTSLIIHGSRELKGGSVDSFNDHRIAMSAAIAATCCSSDLHIHNSDAVKKSYPDFFEIYQGIGGKVEQRAALKLK